MIRLERKLRELGIQSFQILHFCKLKSILYIPFEMRKKIEFREALGIYITKVLRPSLRIVFRNLRHYFLSRKKILAFLETILLQTVADR